MNQADKINYIELPAANMDETERFYTQAFGWRFESYGDDYIAFCESGPEGGFYRSPLSSNSANGAALVVLYSEDLEAAQQKVINCGGIIAKKIYSFPGGAAISFFRSKP